MTTVDAVVVAVQAGAVTLADIAARCGCTAYEARAMLADGTVTTPGLYTPAEGGRFA